MTSIIRLKRQRDEDPIENLMVTCKKFKHEGELQTTCQLTFAGTAKSENDCVRVMKNALKFEALDSFYVCSKPDEEPIKVPKRGTKRARPADDMEVVSSIGAQNLENLFQSKRAKLSVESKNFKFRLLDVQKKTNDKVPENCVYDIFYVRDPSVADASLDVINFFITNCEDICDEESEDEETREEIRLEMNYFDDDIEEENYWTKDYPDEFDVFYEEDEDEDKDDDDDDDDEDEESRFCKEVQNMSLENDYGDYIYDFANSIIDSLVSEKKK